MIIAFSTKHDTLEMNVLGRMVESLHAKTYGEWLGRNLNVRYVCDRRIGGGEIAALLQRCCCFCSVNCFMRKESDG